MKKPDFAQRASPISSLIENTQTNFFREMSAGSFKLKEEAISKLQGWKGNYLSQIRDIIGMLPQGFSAPSCLFPAPAEQAG